MKPINTKTGFRVVVLKATHTPILLRVYCGFYRNQLVRVPEESFQADEVWDCMKTWIDEDGNYE